MKLIKIIRSSVKKNPHAGNTRTYVQGIVRIWFWIKGQLPEHLKDEHSGIIVTRWNDDFTEGYLINEDKIPAIRQLVEHKIVIEKDGQFLEHIPEPKYLYEFENPLLVCENCKSEVLLKEIEEDYDDGDNYYTTCPVCNNMNSFEGIEYEKIGDVIKELGINENL